MWWVGHVALMGERRGTYMVLLGKSKGKNHLEDPGVDEKLLLTLIVLMWRIG